MKRRLILLFLVVSLGISFIPGALPVQADSLVLVEDTYYTTSTNGSMTVIGSDDDVTWATLVLDSGDTPASSVACSYDSGGDSDKWDFLGRGMFQWDTSTANYTSEDFENFFSVTIRAKITENTQTFVNPMSFALFEQLTTPSGGWLTNLAAGDFDIIGIQGLQLSYTDYQDNYEVGDWVEFDIPSDRWENLFVDGYDSVATALMSIADRVIVQPSWEEDETCRLKFNSFGADPAELIITRWSTPPDRVMVKEDNAPKDTDQTGFETADNITWLSPRCAFSDENIIVSVNGESGADINLIVVNKSGGVLVESYPEEVRTDDSYRYEFDLPTAFQGFFRVVDTVNNIASPWGYQSAYDNSMANGYVYAELTNYPQYYTNFGNYVQYDGDMMIIYWETGVPADEFDVLSLRSWYCGDSGSEVYNEVFDDLVSDYWQVGEEDNIKQCAWRFALFAFNDNSPTWNDYDDLIIDLDIAYHSSTSGWYQFLLYQDGEGEETVTHSVEWFLKSRNTDGLIISTDKIKYESGAPITVGVYAGDGSQILDTLADITISVYDSDDTLLNSGTDTLTHNSTYYEVYAPMSGEGYIQVELTDESVSYTYIYRINIVSSTPGEEEGGGAGGLIDQMKNWIGNLGLGDMGGYVLTIGLMILTFALLYSSSVLRVAVPMIILVIALAIGWVDPWVYIPLALGFGFVIFMIFRKKVSGGSGGDEE